MRERGSGRVHANLKMCECVCSTVSMGFMFRIRVSIMEGNNSVYAYDGKCENGDVYILLFFVVLGCCGVCDMG